MPQKKKGQQNVEQSMVLYYLVRSVQRVSLISLVLAVSAAYASIVWILLQGGAYTPGSSVDFSAVQGSYVNFSSAIVSLAAVLAAASAVLSLLLLAFPRVRKFQKQLVIDGVVVSAALLFLGMMSQSIASWFVGHFL